MNQSKLIKSDSMSYLGEDIKKLGFGLMRLPQEGDKIDVEQVKEMVDLFMSKGFTYFDTAWAYPGSEEAIKEALVERYPRETYQLATKAASWIECNSKDDAIKQFEDSLERTGAEYFDYFLLHNLGEARTKVFDDFEMWNYLQEKKEEGLIKHLGFSFHSTVDELEEILIEHPEMEFVQLQINYADWDDNLIQSKANYEIARKYDKPVIVMEPLKGGMLANPPEEVANLLHSINPNMSIASWGIRFASSLEGIITVLSGMSNLDQMKDNLSYMGDFNPLTNEEQKVIAKSQDILNKIELIPCTSCDYCTTICENNIGISGSLISLNSLNLYDNFDLAIGQENWLVGMHGKRAADKCSKCGNCEEVCPQHISIIQELNNVVDAFGDKLSQNP